MGILGMLAAGGAQGLANASNQNVAAQNQLEMEGIRGGREDQREALRQQYLERNFNLQRQDRKEQAAAQIQFDQLKYERGRNDKIVDTENAHRQRLELEGLKESGRDKRSANSIAAANQRAAIRANVGEGGSGSGSMKSTQGKLIEDLKALGLARDSEEAYSLANRSEFLRAALQNPTTRLSADKLVAEVDKITEGLSPGRGLLNKGTVTIPEVNFELDPRTGKLVPNGR